jgi:dGTPase
MMNVDLNKLYNTKRTGTTNESRVGDSRTDFQRDYDRIIFSSAFRRLQNKTQVFPLPGSVFVHNRLTHSLEVSSVGRTLGREIGTFIAETYKNDLSEESVEFYKHNLYNVIASACLCHDIGNPAFGHSGEDAIASFFIKNESDLKSKFTIEEWTDLIHFEGNANAIRVLAGNQKGKTEGGIRLTYSTLASIAKYPCESIARNKKITHRKKFGFFQSEKDIFIDIANSTQMQVESTNPIVFRRHPFVWLVEAADDICYNVIDFEDAHRLGIVEHTACVDLLRNLILSIGSFTNTELNKKLDKITDKNDKVSYLRALTISSLVEQSQLIYQRDVDNYLSGNASKPLFDFIRDENKALQEIEHFSIENIYNNRNVVEIENAGYNVMYELLAHFVFPILKQADKRTLADKQAIKLIPIAFNHDEKSDYEKVMGVIDYVSGMTDNYATELYRRIKGIEMGMRF